MPKKSGIKLNQRMMMTMMRRRKKKVAKQQQLKMVERRLLLKLKLKRKSENQKILFKGNYIDLIKFKVNENLY